MADTALSTPRHAFVCGHPISHSRSPLIHGHWLKTHGLNGSYRAMDITPAEFPRFAATLAQQGLVGGNVTIPHKEAAFAAADSRETAAELIGAANTLWLEDGRLCADNTDAYGFAANLDAGAPGWDCHKSALVIGAGGASRAIIHALAARGFTAIFVANRTQDRARALAHRFGARVSAHPMEALDELASQSGLIVNTTSLGMKGEGDIPLDFAKTRQDTLVTDIVYVPQVTPFLAKAQAHGLNTVDGLGMLLHQAVPGFERWFGVRPEVTPALRDLIIADMGKPA